MGVPCQGPAELRTLSFTGNADFQRFRFLAKRCHIRVESTKKLPGCQKDTLFSTLAKSRGSWNAVSVVLLTHLPDPKKVKQ